jgi:AcrR family transcriptional regulator
LRNGQQPTVTDAAEAAGISRATAYRYFPSQEMLWVEVALFAADGPLLRGAERGTDSGPAGRKFLVWTFFSAWSFFSSRAEIFRGGDSQGVHRRTIPQSGR